MKEETNKRAKLEADNTALRRQMRNMTTMAEEKGQEKSRERMRSQNRREERGRRSPIFTTRTPGKREENNRYEERRGRDPSNRRGIRSCSRDNRRSSSQDRRRYNYIENRSSNSSDRRRYDDWRRSFSSDRRRNMINQEDDCRWWIQKSVGTAESVRPEPTSLKRRESR